MDLFKSIAISIGWITSSFAGIAAILYAFGYLVSRAQLRSLGLFGLFELGPDYYLQEGANFFVVLVSIAIGPIIPWLVYAGLILLFLLIVSLPITIYLYKNGERIAKSFKKVRNGAKIIIEKQQRLWREIVILVLFFFLIFYLANYINEFTPALEISNLLYGRTEDPPHNELISCILSADRGCLEKHFLVLLRGTLEAGLALAIAWHAASPWRLRTWLLAPFLVIFMLYLFVSADRVRRAGATEPLPRHYDFSEKRSGLEREGESISAQQDGARIHPVGPGRKTNSLDSWRPDPRGRGEGDTVSVRRDGCHQETA